MTAPMSSFEVRAVDQSQLSISIDILEEAAVWGGSEGRATWPTGWFTAARGIARLHKDIESGSLYIVWLDGESASTFALLESDPLFWPAAGDEALYLHRFAVRRSAAGVGRRAVDWMISEVQRRGRAYLRLDCLTENPGIRRYYESFGFVDVGKTTIDDMRLTLYELAVPTDAPAAPSR